MKKPVPPLLLVVLLALAMSGCGQGASQLPTTAPATQPTATSAPPTEAAEPPTATPVPPTDAPASSIAKRVVMIIAPERFADLEYSEPRAVFDGRGFEVIVASASLDMATGASGSEVQPDILVSDIVVADYDAIVFVGGGGCEVYWDDPQAHRVAQETVAEKKLLAAICAAPVTLAQAGVLEGKEATVYDGSWKDGIAALEAGGATYVNATVVRDGLIITANGPPASREFGEAIAGALEE
jgi:protease I